MKASERDRLARKIAVEAEMVYQRWRVSNPRASTLDQLAFIYGQTRSIIQAAVEGR